MGGFSDSINPYVKLSDIKNETISYNDISSQYPHKLRKKVPICDYRFIKNFDEMKYEQDKDYGCFLLCNVKTTDKIRNDPLYRQCPMLVSRCKITQKNLSEYQLNQTKEKRQNNNSYYNSQSEKLIINLGSDSNCYLNFEIYQMMKKLYLIYKIVIKKVVIGLDYLEKMMIYLYLIVLELVIFQLIYIRFTKIIILLQIYIEFKILIVNYVDYFVFYSVCTKPIQKINLYLFKIYSILIIF